jgi:VanZ family protein
MSDKLAHFVAFGVLAFLFWRFAESFERKLSARFVWLALIGLGLYAGADEYLQQFVNRHTSWTDWFANLAGLVAVLVALEWRRRAAGSAPPTGPDHSKT